MTATQVMKGLPTLPQGLLTPAGNALRTGMRKLWSDHVIWTRDYVRAATGHTPVAEVLTNIAGKKIVSGIATVPGIAGTVSHMRDADAVAVRLLKNQEDIGDAIEPFYGKKAGKELTSLLKEHIMIAVKLVAAAREGKKREFKEQDEKWDENAQAIASFLAGANPNWSEDQLVDLLSLHLELTKKETEAYLKEDWDAVVTTMDDIFTEIMTLADALAAGIVTQFPAKFRA